MQTPQPATQNTLRPGIVELTFGEPDPALLPVGLVQRGAGACLEELGASALSYGAGEGPAALRELIARRVGEREGREIAADEVLVTGGNSQAIDQVMTVLTEPGDVVLVETPTYNLALGIIADYPVQIVGLPLDDEGLDLDAVERAVASAQAGGRRARLLYTIPTFHNPAGVCLSPPRRRRLLEIARRCGLIVVEDDVYRELGYQGEVPPSLWAVDPEAPVVRLGSFSKSLAPGLRVGWIDARRDLRERLLTAGVIESGGCVSQFAAAVVSAVLAGGGYDAHVAGLRRAYASRRDALCAALTEHLPSGCTWTTPAGGFFVWLALPAGVAAGALLPVAERHGVSFAPGERFCSDGADDHARLAFSLYDEETLAEGARRLGAAIRELQAGGA